MNRVIWILCFAIFMQAMSVWGQSGSVFRDGKEWLQPADFLDYSYDQVKAACPGFDGECSGILSGSTFELTGYTWASAGEVTELINSYDLDLDRPVWKCEYRADIEHVVEAMYQDFALTDTWPAVAGKLRGVNFSSSIPARAWIVDYNIWTCADTGMGGPIEGVWFWKPYEAVSVVLEEPVNMEIHSGIGNLRGWAISPEGIDRIEIYIDGKYTYDAPYGGNRPDVAEAYPEVEDSDRSGFSLAFGYSNLSVGEHTIIARAFNTLEESMDSTSTFEVVAFHKDFINKRDIVDTSQATMTATGDEILLDNVSVDGQLYELSLKWRTAEQGFEIIEIR